MAQGNGKYPFFNELREFAATVTNAVGDVERKMLSNKNELPENHALLKLLEYSDDMKSYKEKSDTMLQEISTENKKYARYRVDIECLLSEIERNLDRVEDNLMGYGYQKRPPQEEQLQEDQLTLEEGASAASNQVSPGRKDNRNKQLESILKTPLLADFGLTSKVTKPSALKDKQSDVISIKKQVHFQSPRQNDKGKENKAPFSVPKTPLLQDYGLPSSTKSLTNLNPNQGKDLLCVKKQLNFRSPLGSISEVVTPNEETEDLAVAEVDDTEYFEELVNSFPTVIVSVKKEIKPECERITAEVNVSTPEEPYVLSSEGIKYLGNQIAVGTPEEPVLTSSERIKYQTAEPSTPTPPDDLDVTSEFKTWLKSQKKK